MKGVRRARHRIPVLHDPVVIDELAAASPPARDACEAARRHLEERGANHLHQVAAQAQVLMRDLGVTFGLYDEESREDHVVPLDPFPRILDHTEWGQIAAGVTQRVRVWNAFFQDIYDQQEALRSGVIPFEIVYSDPGFLRAAVGVNVPEQTWVHVAAFDLTRGADGRWLVIEDHVSTTTGASYALQARHVLGQVSPGLVGTAELLPVHGYATALLEHLRRFARNPSEHSRVVLLSPGQYNRVYYEHSYLARQMGIPLVRGSDLIVLNSQVYLKTIGGLEPIDVIYRRMGEAWIDPVTFREDSFSGVPGLMSCVRKGSVTVVNALGTALGDNRAIAAYLPRLARFYGNESLLLPTVPRRLCHDPDQRAEVLANLRAYFISATTDRSARHSWHAAALSRSALALLAKQIRGRPDRFVAEPQLPLNLLPVARPEGMAAHHAGLRVFVFGGPRPQVYPLALTRFAAQPHSPTISIGLGGGIKDTWLLRDPAGQPVEAPLTVSSPQRRLRLNSRIADSLYWMGRYAERAENTTRIFKVLQGVQSENPDKQNRQDWAPLWEALARATGHPTHFFKRSRLPRRQGLSRYLLLDHKNPSSVIRCLESCRDNARAIRESVPPEVWVVINRLCQAAEDTAKEEPPALEDRTPWATSLAFQDEVLNQLDALAGAAAKNMLRDDGWHFWSMGMHLERALTTVLVMRQVFLKRQGREGLLQRDDRQLDALLRMLSCQYAYRSLFQRRPALHNAARMLLQDPQLPRSVLCCVALIRDSLETVFGRGAGAVADTPGTTPQRQCAQLITEIEFADLAPYFAEDPGVKAPRLRRWLDGLSGRLQDLSVAISDHYLHHQAFNLLA